jgi:hypothetical protein
MAVLMVVSLAALSVVVLAVGRAGDLVDSLASVMDRSTVDMMASSMVSSLAVLMAELMAVMLDDYLVDCLAYEMAG